MKFKTHFLLVALLLLVVACNQTTTTPAPSPSAKSTPAVEPESELDLATVIEEINSGDAILLDVREQAEWDEKHLEGAVLIPKSALEQDIDAAKAIDKSKRVYTHCRRGGRATEMEKLLTENGYDVVALKYSYEDLVEAGFEESEK